MSILFQTWGPREIDTKRENALDGSGDYLVSDKLFALIGFEIIDFRKELTSKNSVKTLKEVIHSLIPSKLIK